MRARMARNKLWTEGIKKLEINHVIFIDIHPLIEGKYKRNSRSTHNIKLCYFLLFVRYPHASSSEKWQTYIHKNGCFYGISSRYTSARSSTFHQVSLCLTCLVEFLELFHSFFFCYSSEGIGLSIFSEIIFNHHH